MIPTIRTHRLPPGRRRGDDGRLPGRLTGKPGICFVTRGPGATNARPASTSPCRIHPLHPVHRPGRQPCQGARGVPGGGLQEVLRRHRQMGGRDRRRFAHSRIRRPRLPVATTGRPGPVVISLPEDMLTSASRSPSRCAVTRRSKPGPAKPRLDALEKLLGRPNRPFVILGGTRWDADAVARHATSPSASSLRRAARSAARCCSTICIRTMPATSASASIRSWRPDQGGRPRAADRRPHGRDAVPGLHAARHPRSRPDARPRPRRRRGARPRLSADTRHQRLAFGLRRSLRKAQAAGQAAWAADDATPHAAYRALVDAAGTGPGAVQIGADHDYGCGTAARRRHHHQRRRQLRHLGAPLLPLPPLRHAGWRRPPARWATACRRRSPPRRFIRIAP